MEQKIIYYKKYADTTKNDLDNQFPPTSIVDSNRLSFDEYYRRIHEQIQFIPIPHRKEKSAQFIDLAIHISDLYQIDTVITRHTSHICVDFSIDCGGSMKYLKPLFTLADDYCFSAEPLVVKSPFP